MFFVWVFFVWRTFVETSVIGVKTGGDCNEREVVWMKKGKQEEGAWEQRLYWEPRV